MCSGGLWLVEYFSGRVRHFSLLRSGLRKTETAPCGDSIAGHFSKSVRSGAPPVILIDVEKRTRVMFPVKVAHPPTRRAARDGWPSIREKALSRAKSGIVPLTNPAYLEQPALSQSVASVESVPNTPPIKAAQRGMKFFHRSAALT